MADDSLREGDTFLYPGPAADADVGPRFYRLRTSSFTPAWRALPKQLSTTEGALAAQKAAVHADAPSVRHMDLTSHVILAPDSAGRSLSTHTTHDVGGNTYAI